MTYKKLLTLVTLLFVPFTSLISEGEKKDEQAPRPAHFEKMLQRLKEKNPQEFERLKKLKEENPDGFKQELRKRMQKRKHSGERDHSERRGPFSQRYEMFRKFLEQYKAKNPDEFKRLQNLRRESPDKFREEMRNKIKDFYKKHHSQTQNPKIKELAKKLQKTKNEADKLLIADELRFELEKDFDIRMKMQRERLSEMEGKIEQLRNRIEEQESNRDKLIENQIKKLLDSKPQNKPSMKKK